MLPSLDHHHLLPRQIIIEPFIDRFLFKYLEGVGIFF